MRKKIIVLFLMFILSILNVFASSGNIKQDSVIECNGIYYGNHGTPIHWHKVEKRNNKWVSISSETDIPACYIKKVNEKEKVLFSKCVDGDTAKFIVNGEERTVRFLAIDTPEIAHSGIEADKYGNEASDFTCNMIKSAKELYLEYDGNSDKEDKYGRILAFVYADGLLVEKELIENGLARVYYIYGDYNYVDELRKEEERARKKKIGIWEDEIVNADIPETETDDVEKNEIISIIIKLLWKLFDLLFK